MLILTRKQDESIVIGDDIVIKIVAVEDNKVKLGIEAPEHIAVHRQEVYVSIQQENRQAVVKKHISMKDLEGVVKK